VASVAGTGGSNPSANVVTPGHFTGMKNRSLQEERLDTNGGFFKFAVEVVFVGKQLIP
jgi:hypothetical protein